MEYSTVNFSLDLILLICMRILCVLLHTQIEGEFSLYLVRLMASFKFILNSLTHWRKKNIKGGWMVPIESLGIPKVILGGLGLYKPSAPSLLLNAPIL